MLDLFSFKGTTDRRMFAGISAFAMVLAYLLRVLVDIAVHSTSGELGSRIPTALRGVGMSAEVASVAKFGGFAAIAVIALAWLAAMSRRFRDMGLSGWMTLAVLLPLTLMPDVTFGGFPVAFLATLLVVITLSLLPGRRHDARSPLH